MADSHHGRGRSVRWLACIGSVILALMVAVPLFAQGRLTPRIYVPLVQNYVSSQPTPTRTPIPTATLTNTPTTRPACHPSYPDFCIPFPPPDLDCPDVGRTNFRVLHNVPDPDPHLFDQDKDGLGCESPQATTPTTQPTNTPTTKPTCDPSYPTVCIPPPPPDLDCEDVPYRRFKVLPPDPHRFDGNDNDGIGCESN